MTSPPPISLTLLKSGKVRDVKEIKFQENPKVFSNSYYPKEHPTQLLAMTATNRVSAFDRYLTDIPHKGEVINALSTWWFNQTQHICPNHLVYSCQDTSIVRKCEPIPIEVVVRAYLTGSTQTSLWTHYQQGIRTYCGIDFPDGLEKNQELPNGPVITPTTKSEDHDQPISEEEIIEQNICTQEEWDYIADMAFQLFDYAQEIANEQDFILVDTKLEFGRLPNNQIILIDELFTCDSSRYWRLSTYQHQIDNGEDPESLDKDVIRKYVQEKYPDIYNLPQDQKIDIPEEKIQELSRVYINFYQDLTQYNFPIEFRVDGNPIPPLITQEITIQYFQYSYPQLVVILSDPTCADYEHVDEIQDSLSELGLNSLREVCSAHQETIKLIQLIVFYQQQRRRIVFIAVSETQDLGSIILHNSNFPVIHCPPTNQQNESYKNIQPDQAHITRRQLIPTIHNPRYVAKFIQKMYFL